MLLYFKQPLKKIIAILLLLLFSFNLYGYRLWFYYVQQQSEQQIISTIEKNEYNEADLVTIKVPLSLPYSTNWSDFERYDGSIEVDGQHYNYVKRKVSNDTLILLCIPNADKNRLTRAKNSFENLVNSGQNPNNNKASGPLSLLKLLTGDYNNNTANYPLLALNVKSLTWLITNNNFCCNNTIPSPWQPPDVNC